ncbi:hypothetical protein niasHS_007769 [Heterodera schachtii]|uniref:F-box associated domain-containing protein n=1 Tax=Heterodera schachtii TaxID=97005 RepID=A0ABD2JPS2_HETSC
MDGGVIAPKAMDGGVIAPKTVDGEVIAPKTVDGGVIAPKTVDGGVIAPKTMDGGVIAPKTVDGGVIAPKTVDGGVIAPKTMDGGVISPNAVFGVRNKMDNRILRKIWICTDIWMDLFPFFDRPQLGLKLALLSPRFNVLVDAHFNGKSELTIWSEITIRKAIVCSTTYIRPSFIKRCFPLSDCPLPHKIRFSDLRIEYIDHSVINFLRSNKHIFDARGTELDLSIDNDISIWDVDVFIRKIWPVFAPNIRRLKFYDVAYLENLCRHTSPTVLTDLDQLKSIDFIADDDWPNATVGQILFKWLHTPKKDGQPKQLRCTMWKETNDWVNNFKEAFLRATISVNFIIRFELSESTQIAPFKLVNERTNENLILRKTSKYEWDTRRMMKRCQIGKTIQWEADNLNNVRIKFDGNKECIGQVIQYLWSLLCPLAGQSGGKGRRNVRK